MSIYVSHQVLETDLSLIEESSFNIFCNSSLDLFKMYTWNIVSYDNVGTI